jgi:hypothetical protein
LRRGGGRRGGGQGRSGNQGDSDLLLDHVRELDAKIELRKVEYDACEHLLVEPTSRNDRVATE